MSFKLGNTNIGELYVGSNKIAQAYLGSNLVYQAAAPIPVLPANTVRVRTSDGNVPDKTNGALYTTATLVEGTSDVYDVYKSGTNFRRLLYNSSNVIEVLGANISSVANMNSMFYGCTLTNVPLFDTSKATDMGFMFANCSALQSVPLFDTSRVITMNYMFNSCTHLTTVPLFDTSKVTKMNGMFQYCSNLQSVPLFNTSSVTTMDMMFYNCNSLTSVPLFDTSKVADMDAMFKNCTKVQSGALALYQQASSQTNPPTNHSQTFYACGSNTQTGAAELEQIPSDWKW